MIEIMIFLGDGCAGENNKFRYPVGEKHPLLGFLRQHKGSAPDFETVTNEVEKLGWKNVNFNRASTLTNVEVLNSMHPSASSSYEEAVNSGFAVIVYSDPIE